MKTILLIGFFLFGITVSSQAQQKYEYAVITYNVALKTIAISVNNDEEPRLIYLEKGVIKHSSDALPAIKEVNKMTEGNWEVYSSNGGTYSTLNNVYYFFLRRPIP